MLNDFQTQKFTHLFNLLDRTGNHYVDDEDLEVTVAAVAKVRGLDPKAPSLHDLLEKYRALHAGIIEMADANKDGRVSLDEFLAYHQFLAEDEATFGAIIPAIAEVFGQLLDHNADGKNDVQDYRMFLRVMRMPEDQVDVIFKRLDKNGDGELSQSEIQELLHEYFFDATGKAPGNAFFGQI